MPPLTRSKCKKENINSEKVIIPSSNKEQFGLIQERIQNNLYHLIVQAILWNQTRGKQAIPILKEILNLYPSPNHLANSNEEELEKVLFPIGLYKQRSKRLKLMANEWIKSPPCAEKRYKPRSKQYPSDDQGWEIAHLPGIGPYALDSFRIFYRDQLLGKSNQWDSNLFEPEWQRVLPLDKDLRAFLKWAWSRRGYDWDPLTGKKVKLVTK